MLGEEEEVGGRRKGGQTGTPTPGTDAPTGLILSEVSDARNRRKYGQSCGVSLHSRDKGG